MRAKTFGPSMASVMALALLSSSTRGHSADTLPFRRGQWAASFEIAQGVSDVGGMRFSSSRAAWVLDLSAAGGSTTSDVPPGLPAEERTSSSVAVSARVGRRRYAPVARQVARFWTVGVLGSGGVGHEEGPFGDAEFTSWSAGIFLELGAAYLIGDHLSLGAAAGSEGSYRGTRSKLEDSDALSSRGWFIRLSPARLIGTVYF